jgi:flagellar assembly protein FliH
MWCRLLTGEKTNQAQAIQWQQAGSAPGPAGMPIASAEPTRALYSDTGPEARVEQAASALREAEQRIAEAYQRGLREGEAAATQRMTEQVRIKVEQLGRSIEQLALHRAKIQREAEPELVRLSLAIARRILRRELTVDPEALLGLLKAGLEKIESSETHRVRVHPEHASILAGLLQGAARPVEIAADPGLPVGAVIFETSRGAIDVGLETQLREIERGFVDLYPR